MVCPLQSFLFLGAWILSPADQFEQPPVTSNKNPTFFKVPCHIIKYCLTKGFAIFQLYMCIKAQMLNKAGLFQFSD